MTTRGAESTTETAPTGEAAEPSSGPVAGEDVLDPAIERVLRRVDLSPSEEGASSPTSRAESVHLESGPRLRSARLSRIVGGRVFLKLRGHRDEIEADVDENVDLELLTRSLASGQAVLIEEESGLLPVVVGMIQTQIPETLELRARKIVIEGEDEVLVRSGTGALRLRQDGDVELVGSRITTMSRGLFRLVGRMLRLN